MHKAWIFCLVLFVVSCESKSVLLTNASPDQNTVITVHGEKNFTMDPWEVTFKIKNKKVDDTSTIEYYNDELTEEQISFNWTDNQHCDIELKEQDGHIIRLKLEITDSRFHFYSVEDES